jgi:hypothetical protein
MIPLISFSQLDSDSSSFFSGRVDFAFSVRVQLIILVNKYVYNITPLRSSIDATLWIICRAKLTIQGYISF